MLQFGFVYHEESNITESNTEFVPRPFSFYYKSGHIEVAELRFEDNYITKFLESGKQSSFADSQNYCEKLYDYKYHIIQPDSLRN